jgi:hypothetical protein
MLGSWIYRVNNAMGDECKKQKDQLRILADADLKVLQQFQQIRRKNQ